MTKSIAALFILTFLFISCETDEPAPNEIEGTYYGSITFESELSKSNTQTHDAFAQVRITGDHEVEVHCSSTGLDTIFRLNYFEHEGNYKVCLTGDAFEEMYHMPYSGPMSMGMMHSGSEWMNHLNAMHMEGDNHYGEFNSNHQSFEYLFTMEENSSLPNMHFKGYRDSN
jgi:hypothetical protein